MSEFNNVKEMYDVFKVEDYPANENGFSQVPINDVQDALHNLFGDNFCWEVKAAGYSPSGSRYFVGNLVVPLRDGRTITVVGAAENDPRNPEARDIGFAGLSMLALRNACLRGLGMGISFYENLPAHPPQVNYAPPVTNTEAPDYTSYSDNTYKGTTPLSNNDWTGEVRIKSGANRGKAWSEMPNDYIDALAGKGNTLAILEAGRRQFQGGFNNRPSPVAASSGRPFAR